MLLQDNTYFDQIQNFNRERIPERVVHAKGAGAIGYLEVTNDISKYSFAKVFSRVPSKTQVVVRFSKVVGEMGTADSTRDTRGFALKFYTPDGIWDLVCNNSPVFFVRDAIRFPNLIHAMRRNPMTHLLDPNAMWDFISLVPETTFQIMMLFSDRGIPIGYRHMHGFGINTFFLVNANGTITYTRFHLRTNQGIQNLTPEQGTLIAGQDPDYFIRDLYNAIESGNLPSWNFSIQVMTPKQAEKFPWNPFDPTKLWPQNQFPLIPIGKVVLTTNPMNYFATVETIAFSPGRLVPGIEPSPDKLLQGRLFAYADTQTYRLGSNNQLDSVNNPLGLKQFGATNPGNPLYYNYMRDGYSRCDLDQGAAVNYFPNSFNGPQVSPRGRTIPYRVSGNIGRYNTINEDNFSQPSIFWNKTLTPGERNRMVMNIAASLSQAYPQIQKRALQNFNKVSPSMGRMLMKALQQANSK
ncbi:catalase isoform X2 [Halyomorpha halys]